MITYLVNEQKQAFYEKLENFKNMNESEINKLSENDMNLFKKYILENNKESEEVEFEDASISFDEIFEDYSAGQESKKVSNLHI